MTITMDFFKEILKFHYKQDLEEMIAQFTPEKDLAAYKMRKPRNESELENLKSLSKVHPLGALLSVMAYVESKMASFSHDAGLDREMRFRPPWMYLSTRYLERYGVKVPEEIAVQMEEVRRMRNLAAHGRKDPTKDDVIRCINTVERFEKFLDALDKAEVKKAAQKYFEERDKTENEDKKTFPGETIDV